MYNLDLVRVWSISVNSGPLLSLSRAQSAFITHLQIFYHASLLDFTHVSRHNRKFLNCYKLGHLEPNFVSKCACMVGCWNSMGQRGCGSRQPCAEAWLESMVCSWVTAADARLRQCLIHFHLRNHGWSHHAIWQILLGMFTKAPHWCLLCYPYGYRG